MSGRPQRLGWGWSWSGGVERGLGADVLGQEVGVLLEPVTLSVEFSEVVDGSG